jgi:hypothetical protein
VSLLQDMLEAAYYASGGEKDRPFAFRWPTPENLARIQRRRDRERVHRADRREEQRRYAREWKREHAKESNRRQRIRYHASKELRDRKAKAQRQRRKNPATRALDSERLSRRQDKGHAREKSRRELKHLENALGLSLAELQRPTYRVETPRGATYLEIWPADDEAAHLIEFAETFEAALIKAMVSPPMDTSAARCPQTHGHQRREGVQGTPWKGTATPRNTTGGVENL